MHTVVSKLAAPLVAALLVGAGLAAPTVAAADTAARSAVQRPAVTDPAVPGSFTAVTPTRIFDSRPTHIAAGGTRTFSGQGGATGVPTTNVSAIVVSVTVLTPAVSGYVLVYPGSVKPNSTTVNFPAGRQLANLAVVKVVPGQPMSIFNGAARPVDAVVVVTGYYAGGGTADGSFNAVGPLRVVDTNTTVPAAPAGARAGSIPANSYRSFTIAGANGIPTTAGAAIMNVTVVPGAGSGYVAVGSGSVRPATSNVNLVPGQTLGTLTAVQLDGDGTFSLFNASATPVRVVVDLAGWFLGSTASTTGQFSSLFPTRIFSSRTGQGTPKAQVPGGGTRVIHVSGTGGVPLTGAGAVALTLTAAGATAAGYLTAYSGARPTSSTLSFPAGVTVPGLAIVPIDAQGNITVFNGSTKPVDVIGDVSGFVRSGDLTVPSTSISRYVNDLLSADTPAIITSKMDAHGCADAGTLTDSDAHVALLEFGAQSNKVPSGASTTTGVLPPNTQGNNQRLTYAQVVTAVKGYLGGYSRCVTENASGPFTVAVGTSNDGYRGATYLPGDKGTDWASKVVGPLQQAAGAAGVGLVGASDIEPNFDGTADEVRTWLQNYLAGNTLRFVNNGAAPACPSGFGQISTTCQPVAPDDPSNPAQTWSQSDYVSFSRGTAPTRISVLPQIYDEQSAVRWENISLTAAAAPGGGPLSFLGVLTQDGACDSGCGLTPPEGWAAMRQALDGSAVTSGTTLPAVTDIRYDS